MISRNLSGTSTLTHNLDGQNNLLILSTLDLIQGMLLLHPQSRKLFAREIHMNVSILTMPILGYKALTVARRCF